MEIDTEADSCHHRCSLGRQRRGARRVEGHGGTRETEAVRDPFMEAYKCLGGTTCLTLRV